MKDDSDYKREYWELHHRLMTLTGKYVALLGKYDRLEEENKKLKREIEALTKQLPKEGGEEV